MKHAISPLALLDNFGEVREKGNVLPYVCRKWPIPRWARGDRGFEPEGTEESRATPWQSRDLGPGANSSSTLPRKGGDLTYYLGN